MMEQMSKNITRQGLTNYTLNFLRVGVTVFGLGLGLEPTGGWGREGGVFA